MLIGVQTSFRTCSTWCPRFLGCCDLARRDSTRSARYFPPVSGARTAQKKKLEILAKGLQGTVSGAPKVRAMELIGELEKEKRGVYAGAVGYFGYGSVDGDKEVEGAMDVSSVE